MKTVSLVNENTTADSYFLSKDFLIRNCVNYNANYIKKWFYLKLFIIF